MRELSIGEIQKVSGGEDPLVLPPVVVTAPGYTPRPWAARGQTVSEYYGFNDNNLFIPIQYLGGGGQDLGPSHTYINETESMSMVWLENPGFAAEINVLKDGWFDVDGDGVKDAGEWSFEAGQNLNDSNFQDLRDQLSSAMLLNDAVNGTDLSGTDPNSDYEGDWESFIETFTPNTGYWGV
jgi:hypothetical protein